MASLVKPSLDFEKDNIEFDTGFGELFEENEQEYSDQTPEASLETGINIQNYNFKLLLRYQCGRSYKNCVRIESKKINNPSGLGTMFWIYQSNSELGIWRFCSRITDDIMYKGTDGFRIINGKRVNYEMDYIQNTLIHITLQQYVNKFLLQIPEFKLLPQGNFAENRKLKEIDLDNNPIIKCNNINEIDFRGLISGNTRMIMENPFFKLQNSFPCGKLNPTKSDIHNLNKFSEKFEELYEFFDKETPFEFVADHEFVFSENIKVVGKIYKMLLIRKTPLINSEGDSISHTNGVILHFMVINLQHCKQDRSPTLNTNISNICKKNLHFMPFSLTANDNINKFGLFESYIMAGAYICKLFDYWSDPNFQCLVEEIDAGKCSVNYAYIGNRYDKLFPFNKIKDQFRIMDIPITKTTDLIQVLTYIYKDEFKKLKSKPSLPKKSRKIRSYSPYTRKSKRKSKRPNSI